MEIILQIASFIAAFIIMSITLESRVLSYTLDDAKIAEKHEEWMNVHGRIYKDQTEKERRFKIFKENHMFIEKFNSEGNRTYKLGINKFSDLTDEEFLARYTGYMKMPTNAVPSTSSHETFRYENVDLNAIPWSLDWRRMGAVTSVKEQGLCGSCWAFSAAATLEGYVKIENGYLISLSEQQIKDCITIGNDGCSGNWVSNAFEYIAQAGGVTSLNRYPYYPWPAACQRPAAVVRGTQIRGYEKVPVDDETALLKAVSMQPISVAVDGKAFRQYSSGIINADCGNHLTHAVTLVGYGTSEYGIDYWLVKNSWGQNWGERGYARIKRDEGLCGIALDAVYPV